MTTRYRALPPAHVTTVVLVDGALVSISPPGWSIFDTETRTPRVDLIGRTEDEARALIAEFERIDAASNADEVTPW